MQEHTEALDDHGNSLQCLMDVVETSATGDQVLDLLRRAEERWQRQLSEHESRVQAQFDQMQEMQVLAAESIDVVSVRIEELDRAVVAAVHEQQDIGAATAEATDRLEYIEAVAQRTIEQCDKMAAVQDVLKDNAERMDEVVEKRLEDELTAFGCS
jgi:hypothetical protein